MKSKNPHSGIYRADISKTLDTSCADPSCNQGGIAIVSAVCYPDAARTLTAHFDSANIVTIPINDKATRYKGGGETRNHDGSGNGLGIGQDGDPAPTITAGDKHAVMTYQQVTDTLSPGAHAGSYNGQDAQNDMLVVCLHPEVSGTICASGAGTDRPAGQGNEGDLCIVQAVDARNMAEHDVCGTLQSKENGGYSLNYINPIRVNLIVRRLTPLECERLQGYPDGWVHIPDYIGTDGKKRKVSDSAMHKALGNSISIPNWKYVMKRIAATFERDATLGSLFDGIGGFPMIWEHLNGKGSAKWASEIEEFAIAVTKYRIG